MPRNWFEGTIIEKEAISKIVKKISIQIDANADFSYNPGQFITLDLPVGQKRLERWRSYSIASKDDKNGIIELCVGKVPQGLGSTYLCDEAEVGSQLRFKGPEGQFMLSGEERQIVLICTGTGVAPFRAMIQQLCDLDDPPKTHLIFGARYEDDILYREELEELESSAPWFSYSVTLSREDWKGSKGYVHPIYQAMYNEVNDSTYFYICGWSEMVDEARHKLKEMNWPSNQVKFELYG